MSLHIFIPCKSLPESKSRLAGILGERERIELSLSMLERTLARAATLAPKARCHLVSNDPDARLLATKNGIETIAGAGAGLNRALYHARGELLKVDGQFELLVLLVDLPYATENALLELVTSGADVAIAPDRDLLGTNALYLGANASNEFPFRFGEKSFDVHCAAAPERQLTLAIRISDALTFDLDTPEHYQEMQGRFPYLSVKE